MTRTEYMAMAFNALNEGRIDEETYDAILMNADDFCEDDEPVRKSYIIDYTRPDGRKDWSTVQASNAEEAAGIFKRRGIDGWSGYNYAEYKIDKIAER